MPPIEKHTQLSLKRTGKEFKEIHEWMDGENLDYLEKSARHDITNIPKFLPIIEKQFGEEAAREYLQHIKDDCENSIVLKILKGIRRFINL